MATALFIALGCGIGVWVMSWFAYWAYCGGRIVYPLKPLPGPPIVRLAARAMLFVYPVIAVPLMLVLSILM